MGITPASIKKIELTWEPPDYTSSYPAGYTQEGVAVIAIMMHTHQSKGMCYTGLSAMLYVSRENGDREILACGPITEGRTHSMLDSCDDVHVAMIGRTILRAWEQIPQQYKKNLVTVVADKHYLKLLFRQFPHLKEILEYRALEKILNPYESHSLGEIHVKVLRSEAGEVVPYHLEEASRLAHEQMERNLAQRPLEKLEEYRVFTDCSFRSTNNKRYSKGGRMGIGGVSEDGFYFHSHYDATNIMTGELTAMLAAFNIFYHGGRQLIIHTDSLGALTFVLRLAHNRWSFEHWVKEGVQNPQVIQEMTDLTTAIRERRVLVKHVPGHTGHGLQESSDSVSKMHRHFPGQIVEKCDMAEFNRRCESIITALSGCKKAVRLMCPDWLQIRPSVVHARNRLWK
ncbi:ribonuclease HI [Rothia terrae]|uniref:RNase H family protein n=1 Tax=Rothia terrae TaxID=396015 RepID=UPI001446619C|nr:RNase H family protein [Rothia terrae]NKZ33662.1 ribonuclease HI [Rothia terrae]